MPKTPKGERPGGRGKGSLNKKTIARLEEAAELEGVRIRKGERRAVDILSQFTNLFAGMAAAYQPLPPGRDGPEHMAAAQAEGRKPDEALFRYYAELTVEAAAALAPFQSPKFKATISVPPPGPQLEDDGDSTRLVKKDGNVYTVEDPAAAQRAYMNMIGKVQG